MSSDIARHDSVPIMNITSKKDNGAKRVSSKCKKECQVNVSKIPVNSNLPFRSDDNNDKQANNLKTVRTKYGKKLYVTYHLKLRNKLEVLLECTCGLADFLAVSETK